MILNRIEPASIRWALVFALAGYVLLSCGMNHHVSEKTIAIPYPQPFPDSIALPFLPGLVSGDSVDFNAAFSPDGESFYFSRRENNQSGIYVTHYIKGKWTAPLHVPSIETGYSEADPVFSPDGKLYFISDRPTDKQDTVLDYDIWFVKPLAGGGWSAPENLKIVNSDSNEYYISFSEMGNLYFASSRQGGFGEEDIYMSRLIDERYTVPENIGEAVNSKKPEYDPFISPKEDFIVFTSSNRDDTFGGGDLYYSHVYKGKWIKAVNLGKNFNTTAREYCAYLTHDSKYFFFSSGGDIKWIDAQFLIER